MYYSLLVVKNLSLGGSDIPWIYSLLIAYDVDYAYDFPYKFSAFILGTYPLYPGICYALTLFDGPPIQLSPCLEMLPYYKEWVCSSLTGGFE